MAFHCLDNEIRPGHEQFAFGSQVEAFKQAIHRLAMSFQLAAGVDMGNFEATFIKCLRDKECPVAVEWFLFRTHECDAVSVTPVNYAFEPALKQLGCSNPIITDASVFVALRIGGATTWFATEIYILDSASLVESIGEQIAIKLDVKATVGY